MGLKQKAEGVLSAFLWSLHFPWCVKTSEETEKYVSIMSCCIIIKLGKNSDRTSHVHFAVLVT